MTVVAPANLLDSLRHNDPARTAVVAGGQRLTFAELRSEVDDMTGRLARAGIGRGSRVGVHLARSVTLPVALLAVWRRGAAYVPLDPACPEPRLAALVADARADAIIAEGPVLWSRVPVITRHSLGGPVPADPVTTGADLAYVIFTSGSSGRPKGVEVTRGNVEHLVRSLEDANVYPPEPSVVAWNASMSFDASVQQWVRVCRGDTLVLLEESDRIDPAAFAEVLRRDGVTDLDTTPSHWDVLADHLAGLPLRVFMGGEPISPRTWARLADDPLLDTVNLYGPTECTVDATAARVRGVRPSIGPPLPGVRAYVLDADLRPADEGELFLAGPGVARGYTGSPGATARAFLPDPHTGHGERMYRTGDKVRRLPDGALEHLHRLDRQVKIRGHRVELGEVEHVLGGVPGVSGAHVTVHNGGMVAHYVGDVSAEYLRAHLAAEVPEFMVPAAFVARAEFARTTSGKADIAALTTPGSSESLDRVQGLVSTVWTDVLGVPEVSATDDFFALGGHSLAAIRVVSRLKKQFGVHLSTKDVYRYPRLGDLAEHVRALSA